MEVLQLTVRFVFLCFNLRNRSSILHALGLLLNFSTVLRFWLNVQPFEPLYLLLFNWGVCILLECVAVEILFQIPWKHLKLKEITLLRCFAFVVIFTVGLINIYAVWCLCMQVHDCVLSHKNYNWMVVTPPLWLAMATAMCHAIVLAICVPCQVIIIPLECNRDIPNINFRSHITLAVNFWLFVHLVYLNLNYSYSLCDVITVFYRLSCTLWMVLYCYPNETYNVYCWFKQQLPGRVRSFLRPIRMTRVWNNVRIVIERRRREGSTIDVQANLLNMFKSFSSIIDDLLTKIYINIGLWLPILISCILIACLLKYCTGWDFTSLLLMVTVISSHFVLILYLMFRHGFLQLIAPINDNSCLAINSSHGATEERFEMRTPNPIKCCED